MSQIPSYESAKVANLRGSAKLFRRDLLSWYETNARDLPWRVDWRKYHSPYHIWLSEIMLQQTVIKAVVASYQSFLDRFPNLLALAAAEEEEVRLAARGLGYYRRFRFLHQAAKQLCQGLSQTDQIRWPSSFSSWKALPGIGDYTAAAIASIAFGEVVPVVDGNVERVFCRLMDIRTAPNLPILKKLFFKLGQDLIDHEKPGDYNQAVMELGQTHCTKQNPNCTQCPVSRHCLAFQRSSQHLAPQWKSRLDYEDVSLGLIITQVRDRIALVERPASAKFLKGYWGFPTLIADQNKDWCWDGQGMTEQAELWQERSVEQGRFRHSITKHRLAVTVYQKRLRRQADLEGAKWLPISEIEANLVSNLDRKAWQLLTRGQSGKA